MSPILDCHTIDRLRQLVAEHDRHCPNPHTPPALELCEATHKVIEHGTARWITCARPTNDSHTAGSHLNGMYRW